MYKLAIVALFALVAVAHASLIATPLISGVSATQRLQSHIPIATVGIPIGIGKGVGLGGIGLGLGGVGLGLGGAGLGLGGAGLGLGVAPLGLGLGAGIIG